MLWWLLQNTIIAAVLAAGVLLVCRWRRIGPAGRHLLWLVVLLKLVTPPLVSWPWAMPRWEERVGVVCPEFNLPWNGRKHAENSGGKLDSGHPTPSTETSDNGTVVRSETFVVEVPAKERDKADRAGTTADVSAQQSDPDAESIRVAEPLHATPPWWLEISLATWLLGAWGCGSVFYLLLQAFRIRRMTVRLRNAEAPPDWLTNEIRHWAGQLRVAPPRTCIASGCSSPFLWAFLRTRLVWPREFTDESDLDAWRGVIVHELAHLKRRDHWVGWLELVAGCVWWWNPLFWYVRSQLRENAELACDAGVVETLPGGRRQYAEALLTVCEHLSRPQVSAVAIGVGGARRNLERRLTMILTDRVPFRVSRGLLCAAGLLALLILPGWAQPPGNSEPDRADSATTTTPPRGALPPPSDYNTPTGAAQPGTPASGPGALPGTGKRDFADPARKQKPFVATAFPAPTDARGIEKQIEQLQNEIRRLQKRHPKLRRANTPGLPMPVDPGSEPGNVPGRPTMADGGPKEVVTTRTITLQRTTYRLPASRAKALKAFIEQNIKAEVLHIEIGTIPRATTPGAGSPMGPMGGFVPRGAGPMAPGIPGPAAPATPPVPVITITTTADVQKAIAGIIAVMRTNELPRDGRGGADGYGPGGARGGIGSIPGVGGGGPSSRFGGSAGSGSPLNPGSTTPGSGAAPPSRR